MSDDRAAAQRGIITVPWVEGMKGLGGYDASGARPREAP